MTPEEEAALLKLVADMKSKLDTADKKELDVENEKLDSLRKEMATLSGEKLDIFKSWSEKELTRSIGVLNKNPTSSSDEPTEDMLVPKLDSAGKEIPWIMRVNWKKTQYPEWK